MIPYPGSEADWLSLVILAVSLCFAVLMSWRSGGFGRGTFVTFLFEGMTLGAAAVVLISVFYKPYFDAVMDSRVFWVIVAVMTISNGFRDIAASFHRSRSSLSEHDAEKQK